MRIQRFWKHNLIRKDMPEKEGSGVPEPPERRAATEYYVMYRIE